MINKNTTNPAALRSRTALARSLVHLLLKRPLKDITIEDITKTRVCPGRPFTPILTRKKISWSTP